MKNPKYNFPCRFCGYNEPQDEIKSHCPHCLVGVHGEDSEGYECGGSLQPIAIWVKDGGEREIIGRCTICGELGSSRVEECDSKLKLLSIASRPIAFPPFPIEKLEEIAKISGYSSDVEEYLS